MEIQYIISLVYLSGFLLSYWMLKVEHEAEKEEWTNGDKAMIVVLAILSWVMIIYMLIIAWSASVNSYWSKPIKNKKAE